MRFSILIQIVLLFTIVSCNNSKENTTSTEEQAEVSPNQILYEQVMDVHDEVMPRMDEIYRLKQKLREKIEKTPSITAAEKENLQSIILKLDSADDGMMDWMHKFKPIPDSLGEERAREYLEQEMVRIKKVKADMETAIELAKQQ